MTDLNAKALEAATYADCNDNPLGEPCLCQRDGMVSGECSDRHERLGNYGRTYLRESGIGAAVEAARGFVGAKDWGEAQSTCDDLVAAVAALDKGAGHE